jgi:hypothetical protein
MSLPPTVETLLILACLRRDLDTDRVQDLMKRGPNWHMILRKTECWRFAPLVYTSLLQADPFGLVPNWFKERLRQLDRHQTIQWIDRREVLRETLQRFSDASIPVIVLNDAAMAAFVYPSPALRTVGKIALLVRRRDEARAVALLKSMRDSPAALVGRDGYFDRWYRGRSRLSLLEIRTHILRSPPADRPQMAHIRIESFWHRSRPTQIESIAALVFSPEDLLLNIAIDLAFAGGFIGHARSLCDIGHACGRYRDALDWGQVTAQARSYQIVKPLYYALHWARELVGADVPSQTLAELRQSFKQVPLEDRLITTGAQQAILLDQPAAPIPKIARLAVHLLKHQRTQDGVALAFRHVHRVLQRRLQRLRPEHPRALGTGVHISPRPSDIAIVLPIYRRRLDGEVLATVDRAIALLQHGDWHLVAPISLETSFYVQRYGKTIVRFPDSWLGTKQNYNRLLLTDEFYATFAQYEYILIVQDDVYVVRDDLAYWQARQYDYIGAPWPRGLEYGLSMSHKPGIHGHSVTSYVGNGGFSLRRVAGCRRLLAEFADEAARFRKGHHAEDLFFSTFGQLSQQFTLPNLRVAAAFAWETGLPRMHALCEGQLPMAIHAYDKHDPDFFARTIQHAAESGS